LKIEVLKDEKDYLEVMLPGEDLGFANFIVEQLLKSGGVFAAASVDHPIKGNPVIRIKGKDPKKSLSKAVDAAKKELSSAVAAVKKL